jgi:hypothetical protein
MLAKKEKLENPGLLLACVQLLQAEKDKLEIFLAPKFGEKTLLSPQKMVFRDSSEKRIFINLLNTHAFFRKEVPPKSSRLSSSRCFEIKLIMLNIADVVFDFLAMIEIPTPGEWIEGTLNQQSTTARISPLLYSTLRWTHRQN